MVFKYLLLAVVMAVYVSGAALKDTVEEMETTTPVVIAILKQINKVNDDGSYTYGFESADGSFKVETRDIDGNVKGKYGYLDEFGELKTIEYSAGETVGFTAEGDHLPEPVAPLPVAPLAAPVAPVAAPVAAPIAAPVAAPATPVAAPQTFNNFPHQQFNQQFPAQQASPQQFNQQFAPQQAPQQFAPQQFAPQQAPQQFAPQQFPPQQFAPQQFNPQQAPQQFAPQQFNQQFAPQQVPQQVPQQFAPQQVPQQFNSNSASLGGVRAPPTPPPQQFNQFAGQQFGAPQQFAPQQFAPQQFAPQQFAPQQFQGVDNSIDNANRRQGFARSFNNPAAFPQQSQFGR